MKKQVNETQSSEEILVNDTEVDIKVDGGFEFLYNGMINLFARHCESLDKQSQIVHKFLVSWKRNRHISFRKAREGLLELLLAQHLETRGASAYMMDEAGPHRNKHFTKMIPFIEGLKRANITLLAKLEMAIYNSESEPVKDMKICISLLDETNEVIDLVFKILQKEDNK